MNIAHRTTSSHQAAASAPLGETGIFEPLLTATEAATLLGVHVKTFRRFANGGAVPSVRVGKRLRFRASALDQLVSDALDSSLQSRRES